MGIRLAEGHQIPSKQETERAHVPVEDVGRMSERRLQDREAAEHHRSRTKRELHRQRRLSHLQYVDRRGEWLHESLQLFEEELGHHKNKVGMILVSL